MPERFKINFPNISVIDGVDSCGGLISHDQTDEVLDFIQSEIDLAVAKAVAKREKEIVKGIINMPVTTLRDDEFKGYIINLITNK